MKQHALRHAPSPPQQKNKKQTTYIYIHNDKNDRNCVGKVPTNGPNVGPKDFEKIANKVPKCPPPINKRQKGFNMEPNWFQHEFTLEPKRF